MIVIGARFVLHKRHYPKQTEKVRRSLTLSWVNGLLMVQGAGVNNRVYASVAA